MKARDPVAGNCTEGDVSLNLQTLHMVPFHVDCHIFGRDVGVNVLFVGAISSRKMGHRQRCCRGLRRRLRRVNTMNYGETH